MAKYIIYIYIYIYIYIIYIYIYIIYIYIYIYILYVYVSNQIQQNSMQPEHVSEAHIKCNVRPIYFFLFIVKLLNVSIKAVVR